MPDFLTRLSAGFTRTGDLSVDAPAFLRLHGRDSVAAHVARVADQARQIAARAGADGESALAAAWLHDISLVLPSADMVAAAEHARLDLLPEEREAPGLLHGKLSAVFAEQVFGVTDPEVLAAIRCHTTLRAGAGLLDRVLFVADKLSWDPEHAPYRPDMAAALEESLDRAVWCFLDWGWQRRERMPVIHPWFREAHADFARPFNPASPPGHGKAVVFVLVHSPLVGPLTWALVASELGQCGVETVVPSLRTERDRRPYWLQHSAAVAEALRAVPPDHPVILVGHSGAGPLLPAVRSAIPHRVTGYLFVDADLPVDGASRLDLFESPDAAQQFREAAHDGLLPTWGEEHLRTVIPDDDLRYRFVAELAPLPLAVYEEPLPVFPGWPDASCGYLKLSPAYDPAAQQARQAGWAATELKGGHFHMLVDPSGVADWLIDVARSLAVIRRNVVG